MASATVLDPPSGANGTTRDLYGFEVKQEYVELFRKYAPLWEAEEVERQERWNAFLLHRSDARGPSQSKRSVSPGAGATTAKVKEVLDRWLEAGDCPELLEQQYQLRSLVQAGIPMSLRGTLWKSFLGLPGMVVSGEYQRLLDQVEHDSSEGVEGAAEETPYYIVHSSRQGAQWVQYVVESAERCSAAASREGSESIDGGIGGGDVAEDASSAKVEAIHHADGVTDTPDVVSMGLPTPPILPLPLYPATPNSEDPSLTLPRGSCQDWSAQIDKDLHRTFPGHPVMDSYGRAALRRILCAYSLRNPSVGYCQGMNFVAGTLLLFMEEEDAFWCLTSIIENLMPGYYSLAMMAPQVDQRVFHRLIVQHFPTLATHLESLCVDASCVTSHWFLCIFVNALPLETCLRVWDVFFLERDATVLFRVGLALVDIFSKALMKTVDSVDAMCQLQATAPMMFDGSRLMTTACIGFQDISRDVLLQHRREVQEEVFVAVKARIDAMDSKHDLEAYHYEEERFFEMLDRESDFNRRNYSRDLNANISMRRSNDGLELNGAPETFQIGADDAMEREERQQTRGGGGEGCGPTFGDNGEQSTNAIPAALHAGRVSRFDSTHLPSVQLSKPDVGASCVGDTSRQTAAPQPHEPSGLGLTQSALQKLSQSPFKLLYILPESLSRSAPASVSPKHATEDGEKSKAALTAYEIASTPASQSKELIGSLQQGTMARVPSRFHPSHARGVSRLSVTTTCMDDAAHADTCDVVTPRRALAFPDSPHNDADTEPTVAGSPSRTDPMAVAAPQQQGTIINPQYSCEMVNPTSLSPPTSGLATPKGRTLSGMLGAWARGLQKSESKPTASPASKAVTRVRELESSSLSSSPRCQLNSPVNSENFIATAERASVDDGNDDASVKQMLWVVENMESEVREAEQLRLNAEAEEARLKQTATDLSTELKEAMGVLSERMHSCVELTAKLERANAELDYKEEEHRYATTMHALCCGMLSLVDSKQR